jgi:hypothetical protein
MLNDEIESAIIHSQDLLFLRSGYQGFRPHDVLGIRQNLIVVTAGDSSLHRQWLSKATRRNFDILISYDGNEPGLYKDQADYYETAPGLKWANLSRLFIRNRELLLSYDACWFPDDDLSVDAQTISRMFDMFHCYNLWLAQPALTAESRITHPVTEAKPNSRLRFTDFVEIVCPIFNRVSLAALGPTFAASASGYALDYLWPYLLGYPKDRIGILDEVAVVRLASARDDSFLARCLSIGVNPGFESDRIIKRYGLNPELRRTEYMTIPLTSTDV